LLCKETNFYLWCDKFPGQQANGRQCTVGQERNGCPGVYDRVNIRKPLQKLQSTTIAIPKGTVLAEENFNRSKSPPKDLMETVGKIERCRTFECRPLWDAVNRPPTMAVHLKSSQDIFCN
jgi:hypothetical protein